MISNYLNQSLTWKHVSTLDQYNQPTYTTSTIKGRKEGINRLITNKNGQVNLGSSIVFTKSAITVNDLIDDSLVLRSDAITNFDGTISHYEVYLGENYGGRS